MYGALMRRVDRVVAVSTAVREESIDFFHLAADRVVTIPNGVDPRRLRPTRDREATRQLLGIPARVPVALSLGALTWEKDPATHLAVAEQVLAELPEAIHLFAGDGPLRPRLEAEIDRRGLRGRVLVLGSRRDVGDLLAASDVMLLASRTEGMPGCLIEAGMAGLPSVAYAIAGVPEVIEDGVTGLLVAPGDRTELARSVAKLLGAPELRASLGTAARQRCMRDFHIDVIAPRYQSLFEELAG